MNWTLIDGTLGSTGRGKLAGRSFSDCILRFLLPDPLVDLGAGPSASGTRFRFIGLPQEIVNRDELLPGAWLHRRALRHDSAARAVCAKKRRAGADRHRRRLAHAFTERLALDVILGGLLARHERRRRAEQHQHRVRDSLLERTERGGRAQRCADGAGNPCLDHGAIDGFVVVEPFLPRLEIGGRKRLQRGAGAEASGRTAERAERASHGAASCAARYARAKRRPGAAEPVKDLRGPPVRIAPPLGQGLAHDLIDGVRRHCLGLLEPGKAALSNDLCALLRRLVAVHDALAERAGRDLADARRLVRPSGEIRRHFG